MGEERVRGPLRILCVEDSDEDFFIVRKAFEAHLPTARLTRCVRAEEALERLVVEPLSFDLLLAEHRLPGMSGLELCRELRSREVPLALVMLTDIGPRGLLVEARKAGVDECLVKDLRRSCLEVLPAILPKVVVRHRARLARCKTEEGLRRGHEELGPRVRERTGELVAANGQLRREIEGRRRAEGFLREAEHKYRTLVEQANDAIVILQNGRVVYHNPVCEDLLGYTVEEARGRDFLDFIHPKDRERVRENYLKRLRGEAVLDQFEVKVITRSGERLTLDVKPRLIEYQGRPATMVVARDITARKQAEEELRNSERRLADIINFLPDATFVIDREGRVLAWNRAMEEMTGVNASDMLGKGNYGYSILFHGERRPILIDLVLEPDRRVETLYQFIEREADTLVAESYNPSFKGGAHLWGKARLLYGSQGRVVGAIETIRDITTRKRAEEELRRSKEFLDNIINALDDPVFVKDEQHRWVILNDRSCDLMGRPREDLLGKSDYDLFAKEQADVFWEKDALVLATGEANINEEKITWHGKLHTISTKKSLFTDSVTGKRFIAGTIRDITESKRAEQRFHRYEAQLRSLASELSLTEERERRRLATGLHDAVGQSLAMAKLKMDALRSGVTSETPSGDLDEVVRLIEEAIQHTRSLTFELSPPVLYELGLEAALESLVERMEQEHDMRIEFASDGRSYALGEDLAVFCFRAVQELLINVVKHARTREAKLSLSREGGALKIMVSDQGVGFLPGTMPTKAGPPKGYGLFSIQERARDFGGHLEVDAKRGRGTRVTLIIPLPPTT